MITQLKEQSQRLASPLHRIEEIITSKKLNASDPHIRALFVATERNGYGSKDGEIKYVQLEKVQYGYKDADKLVSRYHLRQDQIANLDGWKLKVVQ